MQIHATKTDAETVTVQEPVSRDVRYTMETRDGEQFAALNLDDLSALYDSLPHGASQSERGDIECYLCSVAEGGNQ